jgi:DNA repair protein RadC
MSKSNYFSDDPRQTLLFKGTSALSDAENLSIVISGKDSIDKARNLLSKVNNSYDNLARLSHGDLVREGLAPDQAFRVIACNNYAHRKQYQTAVEKTQIRQSKDIFDLMSSELSDLTNEEFWVIFMNRSNKILGKICISKGGVSGTVTDVKMILKKSLEFLASGIIVCHNHPSGNLKPSESDSSITKKIKEAALLMDIQLLDHIIISEKEYYSFADNGLI